MILVDTSILGRMAAIRSPLHAVAMKAVQAYIDADRPLCVAPQSLCEFWVVATRPTDVNGFGWQTSRAMDWIHYFEYFFRLMPDDPRVHPEWRRLVQHYDTKGKAAHDARLVALMNVYGIASVLTFDTQGFARYPITVRDPRSLVAT